MRGLLTTVALLLALALGACRHAGPTGGAESPGAVALATRGPLAYLPGPAEDWRMGQAVAFEGALLALGAEFIAPPTPFERLGRIEVLDQGVWSQHRPGRKRVFRPWPGIDRFDPAGGTWSHFGPPPAARRNAVPVVLEGKLYLIGGWPRDYLHRVDIYDPATGEWSLGPPTRQPRNHHTAVVVEGKLLVHGGLARDNRSCVETPEVFDPATGRWSELRAHPAACRYGASAAVHEGKVYLFGGRRDRHRLVDIHDPATDTYGTGPELPQYLYKSAGAAELEGKIYVLEDSRRDIHLLEPGTGTWTLATAPPGFQTPGPVVRLGQTLYLLGPGPRPKGEMERRTPGDDEPPVWRCAGVVAQRLPPCDDCRRRVAKVRTARWSRALGPRAPTRAEAVRGMEQSLKAWNAEEQVKFEERLRRHEEQERSAAAAGAKAAAAAGAAKGPAPGGGMLRTGGHPGVMGAKQKAAPPTRPHPWRLDHTVCYASPGGRTLPSLGKDRGTYSAPRREEGKLLRWW